MFPTYYSFWGNTLFTVKRAGYLILTDSIKRSYIFNPNFIINIKQLVAFALRNLIFIKQNNSECIV